MDADDEEARREILRRRAIFVATALAGIAVTGCSSGDDGDAAPQACLEIAVSSSRSASAAPRACLKVAVDEVTRQPSSSSVPSGPTAESPSAVPSVPASKASSLPTAVPTPRPRVCLSPLLPTSKEPEPG
jgi:hypothetical protein